MVWPTPKLAVGLDGLHVTVAPGGKPVGTHVASAATLGPLLVQVSVPVTALPADGLPGKPLNTAAISACGVITSGSVAVLLPATGSAVVVLVVAVMLSVPLAGALNVLVQVTKPPVGKGSGVGLGSHDTVAPGGKPVSAQVGANALLGPALVHTPVTVTG
jgi:hypothetical protein